jgi:streptomycin 6-kinase
MQGVRSTTMAPRFAEDLQHRIDAHVRGWSVQVERTTETETSVLLFGQCRGRPVVLKVLRMPGDEWRSGEVLAAFEGRAAARVYEHAGGALLLEDLRPGTPLVELVLAGRDDDAVGILADVIGAMAPRPAPSSTPTVLDWARGFEHYRATDEAQIPKDLLAEAHGTYVRLSHTQSRVRLLHGDLQHSNVLFDARRGWLAIDPKGVVGETEFEVGAALRNPWEWSEMLAQPAVIERRLRRYANTLAIDRGRALMWGFAQGVLSAIWTVEDGFPLDSHHAGLRLAHAIRPMLGALP